jgi:glycosyltransferase involved in cell wall biosynthesis
MRLLRVISSTNPAGGGPIEGIRQLRQPLAEMGVDVEIASCDAPDAPWLAYGAPMVHPLGPSWLRYRYTPRLLPWLRANASRYDVVVVHGIWQYHSFAVWQALHDTGTPYFVFPHGMLDPWFRQRYPLKHLKKSVYWPWTDYRLLRDARAVIFTCEEERVLAHNSFRPYDATEAVTTYGTAPPPVVDPTPFLDANPQLQDKRVVLFLSRFHEKKGCDLLIDAFSQVAGGDDRLHLLMVGPDQTGWVSALRTQAKRLGIDQRITWMDMLQGTTKWAAFQAAEVFCLPSHQENFGIVVAEALGCGKPVLISSKVNIWREVKADEAGFVDEDTADGTARNLRRWLALDDTAYSAMCLQARRCFASRFHIQGAAERLVEIVQTSAGLTDPAHVPDVRRADADSGLAP